MIILIDSFAADSQTPASRLLGENSTPKTVGAMAIVTMALYAVRIVLQNTNALESYFGMTVTSAARFCEQFFTGSAWVTGCLAAYTTGSSGKLTIALVLVAFISTMRWLSNGPMQGPIRWVGVAGYALLTIYCILSTLKFLAGW